MPIVEKAKQNTPSFCAEVTTSLAGWKQPGEAMLYILCGAAGRRVGEALGLEIGKQVTDNFRIFDGHQGEAWYSYFQFTLYRAALLGWQGSAGEWTIPPFGSWID
jgi:hypothetical protein